MINKNHACAVNSAPVILPVILAGGVGSRLWPLSREAHPKPFIRLDDDQSLIQKTYLRAAAIQGVKEILTVTNRELFFYTRDEYEEVPSVSAFKTFILEPCGRNSAAAIALAAHYAQKQFGDGCMLLILSADHLITQQDAFIAAVQQAVTLALQGRLVTFGVRPKTPETGYGYIEAEGHDVLGFVEKPDLSTAQSYVASGKHYWNSGIFCIRTDSIMAEMATHCPAILSQAATCMAQAKTAQGADWLQAEIPAQHFATIQDISIDYAVFEKSDKVAMVACDMGWSDVGSWLTLGQLHPKDAHNNHIHGDTVLEDVEDCIIHNDHTLVAAIGLRDLIIVNTSDALLVSDKKQVQQVRAIVKTLKQQQHQTYQCFPTVHRPWGNYTVLQAGDGFKLKRIEVKPGASLSLQSHQHRSEHWVVVSGLASIMNGEQTMQLEHNQSTYIPAGHKHRLENAGKALLVLIEVQCGAYLGEDDIVRYNDIYGRIQ